MTERVCFFGDKPKSADYGGKDADCHIGSALTTYQCEAAQR